MRLLTAIAVATLVVVAPGFADALAAPPKKEQGVPPAVLAMLASSDASVVRGGLELLRAEGNRAQAAAPKVAALLESGVSLPLTQAAIETLGALEAEATSSVLATYTRHRSVVVRAAAVQAIARTRGPEATRALRAALAERDGGIREAAATGLLLLRAPEAAADLLRAAELGVPTAASAFGASCRATECERLVTKSEAMPFSELGGGLSHIVVRPDVDEATKLRVVAAVSKIGSDEALVWLRALARALPAGSRVRRAIEDPAVRRR